MAERWRHQRIYIGPCCCQHNLKAYFVCSILSLDNFNFLPVMWAFCLSLIKYNNVLYSLWKCLNMFLENSTRAQTGFTYWAHLVLTYLILIRTSGSFRHIFNWFPVRPRRVQLSQVHRNLTVYIGHFLMEN